MTALPEIVFPRNPGTVGTLLPPRPSPQLLDMKDMDYEGYNTGSNGGRAKFELDPFGTSRTVLRIEVRYGDNADRWGGNRFEMFPYPFDHVNGTDAWQLFDWGLGDGVVRGDRFLYPSGWALMFQNFSEPDGSPPQALEINKAGEWIWNARKDRNSPVWRKLGLATLGKRHFVLAHTKFEEGATGRQRVWHSVDKLPDPDSPPAIDLAQNTLYQGRGHAAVHMYRQPGPASEYPWVAYFGRYVRANTAALAIERSGWAPFYSGAPTPLPPLPAPDPTKANTAIQAIRPSNPKIAAAVQATLDYTRDVDAGRNRT